MSDFMVRATLRGAETVKASLLLLDSKTRAGCYDATRTALVVVKSATLARVHRRSGELASTVRTSMDPDYPRGYLQIGYGSLQRRLKGGNHRSQIAYWLRKYQPKESADMPGVYAMVEEFGDAKRHHAAHPAVVPSIEEERPIYRQAIADVLKDAAHAAERGA